MSTKEPRVRLNQPEQELYEADLEKAFIQFNNIRVGRWEIKEHDEFDRVFARIMNKSPYDLTGPLTFTNCVTGDVFIISPSMSMCVAAGFDKDTVGTGLDH